MGTPGWKGLQVSGTSMLEHHLQLHLNAKLSMTITMMHLWKLWPHITANYKLKTLTFITFLSRHRHHSLLLQQGLVLTHNLPALLIRQKSI